MPSLTVAQVARAMFAWAPGSASAAQCLRADEDQPGIANRCATSCGAILSGSDARRLWKGGRATAGLVETIVAHCHDEDFLDDVARRDRRIGVRSALIAAPSWPLDKAARLAATAANDTCWAVLSERLATAEHIGAETIAALVDAERSDLRNRALAAIAENRQVSTENLTSLIGASFDSDMALGRRTDLPLALAVALAGVDRCSRVPEVNNRPDYNCARQLAGRLTLAPEVLAVLLANERPDVDAALAARRDLSAEVYATLSRRPGTQAVMVRNRAVPLELIAGFPAGVAGGAGVGRYLAATFGDRPGSAAAVTLLPDASPELTVADFADMVARICPSETERPAVA